MTGASSSGGLEHITSRTMDFCVDDRGRRGRPSSGRKIASRLHANFTKGAHSRRFGGRRSNASIGLIGLGWIRSNLPGASTRNEHITELIGPGDLGRSSAPTGRVSEQRDDTNQLSGLEELVRQSVTTQKNDGPTNTEVATARTSP